MIITAGVPQKIENPKSLYGKNFNIPIHTRLGNIATSECLVHDAQKVQAIFASPKLFMWRYFKNHWCSGKSVGAVELNSKSFRALSF